jgi:hypothetical protein
MNPYQSLPDSAFWKLAVSSKNMFDVDNLWNPKFDIQSTQAVVTFGSCFAQHIGTALKARGFNWLSTEVPPLGLSKKNARLLNYDIFSARTGNIYTTSLLRQWTEWALGISNVPNEIWVKDSRYYDPFRPVIEPNGFESEEEMRHSQAQAIRSFRESILQATYFVFTLGLTESWINTLGYEYPMCPGTAAGEFDPAKHEFKNQQFPEILQNLQSVISMMQHANPSIKFILTVSPVPLTATMSNRHVLVATTETKSILRAVAGQLATNNAHIDYFPGYELVNSPIFKGIFFEPNQRNVNPYGVNYVMDIFLKCLENKFGKRHTALFDLSVEDTDEICEEELLDAFKEG